MDQARINEVGAAWAEQEFEACDPSDDARWDPEWRCTWMDALPLLDLSVDDDAREEIARMICQAASKEWDRIVARYNAATEVLG